MYNSFEKGISLSPPLSSSGLFSLFTNSSVPDIIGNNNFKRIKYHHSSQSNFIQMFPYTKLQQSHISQVFSFCYPYPVAKFTNTFRRITPAAHTADGWHAGIIPSCLHVFQLPIAAAFVYSSPYKKDCGGQIHIGVEGYISNFSISQSYNSRCGTNSSVQMEWVTCSMLSLWPCAKSYIG